MAGVEPWVPDLLDLPHGRCGSLEGHPAEVAIAERWLWRLAQKNSGRSYGINEVEARVGDRPVRRPDGRHALPLPGPIESVSVVEVAGTAIDEANNWVVDDGHLVLIDRTVAWPSNPDPLADPSAAEAVRVVYRRGTPPPPGFELALSELAAEIVADTDPHDTTRLPQRLTSITRENVSVSVLDPLDLFADGLTGLSQVDAWLGSLPRRQARHRGTKTSTRLTLTTGS